MKKLKLIALSLAGLSRPGYMQVHLETSPIGLNQAQYYHAWGS